MKAKMKLFVLFAILVLSSCSNDLDLSESVIDHQDGVEVPIVFSGDIQQSDEIMTRAANSSNDLLGIQIYRRTAGSTGSWSVFAYGLYDHLDNLSVYLQLGYEYKAVATLVKNGKEVLYDGGNGDYGNKYPFYYNNRVCNVRTSNKLAIETDYSMSYLANVRTTLAGSSSYVSSYPQVDRLYGEVEGIIPTDNTSIDLDLKRVSFGLSCSVNGLEEGSLSVKVKNSAKTFFDLTDVGNGYSTPTNFYTFTNMISGAYEHLNSYYETLTVSVTHKHSIINISEELGTVDVKVYRNKVNNIKINLNATTTRSASHGNSGMNVIVEQENID